MKKIFIFPIFLLSGFFATAQVEKTIIVEHFTNSRCGVCASKNPGLYQNLENNPNVMHIAFHPSSPYASCIFSQYNPDENDNRTKYYSIFGGTPWLVIQGEVQSSGTNFGNPALFDPFLGQTTPFWITIKEYRFEENNIQVEVTIKAVSPHSQEQALLFLGFAEDTVFYASPNGEPLHTDVFRKALTEITGDIISLPAAGDSVTMTYNITPDNLLNIDRMYTMAILQDPGSKLVLQAGKTTIIEYMDPNFIGSFNDRKNNLLVYPNPAKSRIYIDQADETIFLMSLDGKTLQKIMPQENQRTSFDISGIPEGMYILKSGSRSALLSVIE